MAVGGFGNIRCDWIDPNPLFIVARFVLHWFWVFDVDAVSRFDGGNQRNPHKNGLRHRRDTTLY